MKRPIAFLAGALFCVAGCVTPHVTESPVRKVDFSAYKSVHLTVERIHAQIGANDGGYAEELTSLFELLLQRRLKSLGYLVVPESGELQLDVAITAVKPGSAAARFWVGFGAGRAVFTYDAKFLDSGGAALGNFSGGRSHTGMEIGESFADKDQILTLAATRAVSQIEQFIQNDGQLPEIKRPVVVNPNAR